MTGLDTSVITWPKKYKQ